MVLIKSAAVWLLFVVMAILNGGLREKILNPSLGQNVAEPLSALLLSLMIFLVTLALVAFLGVTTNSQAWQIGTFWLVLTVAFEFLFGHFVVGDSWQTLLEAYKFWTGNLWVIVLLVILCAPYLTARLRGII